MKIIDIRRVLGRGYVFIVLPDTEVHVGDSIRVKEENFEIRGIERLTFNGKAGLILANGDMANDVVSPGDYVEIINKRQD